MSAPEGKVTNPQMSLIASLFSGGVKVTSSTPGQSVQRTEMTKKLHIPIRAMSLRVPRVKADVEFQKAIFGEVNADNSAFTRGTRRLIALIGMCNFAIISILCTLYPGVELVTFTPPENKEAISILFGLIKFPSGADITTSITTGHISLVSIATLGAIVGFYFTPGGKR